MTTPAHGISVENDADYPIEAERLVEAAQTVIAQHGIDSTSAISIIVTDDEQVHALNAEYRGTDSVTDILSFPADSLPPALADELDEPPYLGDLVIAYPYASAQAISLGHAIGDSLSLLIVHGTLHLLGYDHDTPERRAEMWTEQERALITLGLSPSLVPGLEEANHD